MRDLYKESINQIRDLNTQINKVKKNIEDIVKNEIYEYLQPKGFEIYQTEDTWRTKSFYNKGKKIMFFYTVYSNNVWITIHDGVTFDGNNYHYNGEIIFADNWNFKSKDISSSSAGKMLDDYKK